MLHSVATMTDMAVSREDARGSTGSLPTEFLEVNWDDVELGRLIGSGTFASVYIVEGLRSQKPIDSKQPENSDGEVSETAVTLCNSESNVCASPRGSFALKCIQGSFREDEKQLKLAGDCLSLEAKILASLPRHPNIIRLVGLSAKLEDDPTRGFLLLQRVADTLDGLLKRWKIRSLSSSFLDEGEGFFCFFRNRKIQEEQLQHEQASRVQHVAIGLAKAMTFLHHHRILYRDLKPSNVGLDFEGQVRLFDFGFARTYEEDSENRLLTKTVGSARYMAPEVQKGRYGFSSDVHSFAVLLWEILTLRKPYSKIKTLEMLERAVHRKDHRPSLRYVCSRNLRKLLKASWHPDPKMRPSFVLIVRQLEIEGSFSEKSFP